MHCVLHLAQLDSANSVSGALVAEISSPSRREKLQICVVYESMASRPLSSACVVSKKRKIDDASRDACVQNLEDLEEHKSQPRGVDNTACDERPQKVSRTAFGGSVADKRSLAEHLSLGATIEVKSDPFNVQLLKSYYERLFPVSLMWKWLSYDDSNAIKNREFSFTLEHDVYVRYRSYKTKEEFKAELVRRLPIKIDIGAVYNASPLLKDSVSKFMPVSKELVFDVDLTDYDDVRTCCSAAAVCKNCWPLMSAAITVTDAALRNDFGFKHVLWVFSGRRGMHCWVCDDRARALSNEGRTAIVEYLSLQFGKPGSGTAKGGRVNVQSPKHPSLTRAYELLLPAFEMLLEYQGILSNGASAERALEFLDPEVRAEFAFPAGDNDSTRRWQWLKSQVERKLKASGKRAANRSVTTLLQNIVFQWAFPRLDVNVSKQLNHLLKSPFCVHPKTGMVCVPVDPETSSKFDPCGAPTLRLLIDELNKTASIDKIRSWKKTSLKPHIEYFERFVQQATAGRSKQVEDAVEDETAWLSTPNAQATGE